MAMKKINQSNSNTRLTFDSDQLQLHPPCLPTNILPSYSSVKLPQLPSVAPCASEEFIAPIPPPSYAQTFGFQGVSSLTSSRSTGCSLEGGNILWQGRPQHAFCARCNVMVLTTVVSEETQCAQITFVVLCVLMCWPFCLLPLCIQSCKKTTHHCPYCQTVLGESRHI